MNRLEEIKNNFDKWEINHGYCLSSDDIEYLLNEVERLKGSLKKITNVYGVYGPHENYSYEMNGIAEEALKDEKK